jgi:dipeptidyl aminopeptidase/acylaminoacyl peptidase
MKSAALLVLFTISASFSFSQREKIVDPADIANLKQVSTPQISPDGKVVAYVVNTPVAAGEHKDAHIWITPTDEAGYARPFVMSAATDIEPRWSPDGESIAFLSDRRNPLATPEHAPFQFSLWGVENRTDLEPDSDKKDGSDPGMQLWLISLHGGEAVPLTHIPGGIKNFRWSRDGKFIAFIHTDQDTAKERERKKQKNDEILVDRNYKYDRLWIYDVAQHQARLLTKTDINIDAFDWSPDGKEIVARVSPTSRIDDYWRISKIEILNVSTGLVTKTLEEHAGYMEPRWSPDGRRVAFSRMRTKRITDEHVVYNLSDGKAILVEDDFPGTVEQMEWEPDGVGLVAQATEQAHTVVLRIDASSGKSSALDGAKTSAGEITLSSDGKKLAFLGQTSVQPDEVWVYADGRALAFTDTNPQVKSWKLGTERELTWKSSKDGRTIHGLVDLPPGYEEGRRYKTVVHVHGGPEEAWTTGWHGNWYNYAAMLASHGYVVLLSDPRGSDGAGPAYTESNFQDWGGGDFQDVMDGVDALVAEGIADPDHLAIGGWSFGGYMTAWAVTHTNRFKAAMVGAGVTDLFSMATTTDISPSFSSGYFGDLETNRKLYDEHSPVRYLGQCHTPVLVLHGEADPRVPISQGEEFYNGLRFLGRDVIMVRYPREPHIFTEREHQIDSLSRILNWYESHFRDDKSSSASASYND